MSRIIEASSDAHYNELVSRGLVFVDFSAPWCAPCKEILPSVKKWSTDPTFQRVTFVSVDTDKLERLYDELELDSLPTFLFYRDGVKVDSFAGAKVELVLAKLQKFVGSAGPKQGEVKASPSPSPSPSPVAAAAAAVESRGVQDQKASPPPKRPVEWSKVSVHIVYCGS